MSWVPTNLELAVADAVRMIEELEAKVLERDALVLERDQEIDKLLVEAVVLREKQDRHDAVLAERDNRLAFDQLEIRRLKQATRHWWGRS